MAFWTQLYLQDPVSPAMSQLIQFHDSVMITLTLVTTVITYSMIYLSMNNLISRYNFEAQEIEAIWTIIPAIVLITLAMPSIRLLYIMEETFSNSITIKTIGHQWYWTYQYSDFIDVEFDSYMTQTNDLNLGDYRLLEVDNRFVVPMNHSIRMMVTAADVLHSWTIPALGVKMDAVPGRLNQITFSTLIPGVYYGQCSEICGVNHSFMPIAMEVIKTEDFINWLKNIE
uniref:Cytochrome c oxidase subunit 2 n=1 Tax=Codonobdella sp. IK-2021 TaxID=2848640 RepID=A0A8F2IW66_9ANNE|nr:cytochrome c oxidase subunit II [Codonobdella sp. B45A]QWT29628.1 cytochrome c oxidase subunit 2 [Codonobdella sp. IK-2021]UTS56337.1 cytochrome c oxidase subunit 2 [Codonobdella sp. B45A]